MIDSNKSKLQMPAARRTLITTEQAVLAFAYACWLASYPLMMFLLPNYEVATGIGLCIGLGITLLHILLRPDNMPTQLNVWIYVAAFGSVILISQLIGNFEGVEIRSVIQAGAMIIVLFIAAYLGSSGLYSRILPIYAILVSPVLLLVYIDGDFVWGRLVGRAQPNFWGLMALSCGIAALSIQQKLLRAFAFGVALLILYATNSRGSMVGTFAALVTAGAVYFLIHSARKKMVILSVVLVVIIAGAWSEIGFEFISNELFRVGDPHRGIETGFTGRLDPWLYGLSVALERPLFGYGYRESKSLFGPVIGIDSAHNGYISMLIDTGIIGLLLYLVFITHTIWIGFRRMHKPLAPCALGYLVGYAVIGLFERYALNAGQPLSILFLISAFYILAPMKRFGAHAPIARALPAVPAARK